VKRTGTKEDKDACYLAAAVSKTADEVTSSSEEIKPIALSIVELGISQLVSK